MCGRIAQSVEKKGELTNVVFGVAVGYCNESIRSINYNALFTYAVQAKQELHDIVKQQQLQIEELNANLA